MKKKTTKQERVYMGRVAELGCIICGGIPEYTTTLKIGVMELNQVIMI